MRVQLFVGSLLSPKLRGSFYRLVRFSSPPQKNIVSYSMSVEALERDELGFLSDPRLLNTAVTRAKYHLAFVGDPSALCGAGECKACKVSVRLEILCQHPSIRIFSSEYFYTGKPVFDAPETTDSIIRLDGFWPNRNQVYHLFCHVTGKEHTATCFSLGEDREDCRFNPAEVDMIVSLVERLASHNIKMKYITIISPFSTQRAKIRDALKHQPNVEEVQITSPQDSQGSENAFVIISTVRSKSRDQSAFSEHSGKVGCLGDAHQMNVALTRARLGLIILGDQEFLRSIPIWNKLINEYKSSDCVVDGRSWP